MKTLLLQFKGSQSWGSSSKYGYRYTRNEPTKSAVVGMICSAMNIRKDSQDAKGIASLHFVPIVVREGSKECDFHMATEFRNLGDYSTQSAITYRYYLADALFFVSLTGDTEIIQSAFKALCYPVYHLYMGRMCCPLTIPLVHGVYDISDTKKLLEKLGVKGKFRVVVETDPKDITSENVFDVPDGNTYRMRQVKSEWIEV